MSELSLRDQFAMTAMVGFSKLLEKEHDLDSVIKYQVSLSFRVADEMLKQRGEESEERVPTCAHCIFKSGPEFLDFCQWWNTREDISDTCDKLCVKWVEYRAGAL